MKIPKPTPFDCAVCGRTIGPRRLHIFIGRSVVCMDCAGTTAAHDLSGCPVDWHDAWDHGYPASDRLTATAVVAQGRFRNEVTS